MRIAITGSTGFIGSELVKYFVSKGDNVLMLQRKSPARLYAGASYLNYDLNDVNTIPDFTGFDALIHTAYIAGDNSSEANIKGTLSLCRECGEKGVQFVFLSSMSAHENALSEYGKHKFELENLLDKEGCLILKLGLVIGKQGLFSRIQSAIEKTGFIFLIGGGKQPVQTVFMGDVATTIDKCISGKITGKYRIATPHVYTMKDLSRLIAERRGKKFFFIPVPYWAAIAGINMIELLHLPFPVSKENLLGLKQLQAFDTSKDLDKLGITLLDLKLTISRLNAGAPS